MTYKDDRGAQKFSRNFTTRNCHGPKQYVCESTIAPTQSLNKIVRQPASQPT